MIAAAVATGVVFAATKLWVPAGDAYRFGVAALQWPFRVPRHRRRRYRAAHARARAG